MRRLILFCGFIVWLSSAVPLLSQGTPWEEKEYQKLAQSTMTFLSIEVGGRPVAMGGAFTCIENDISGLFWNPAGIAKIKGAMFGLDHTQWIADTRMYVLGAAYGFRNMGTIGVSLLFMDNGSIDRTIPDSNHPQGFYTDGTFQVGQWAAGLAYARQLTDRLSCGGQVKYAYQDLGEADIVDWSSENAAFDTLSSSENQRGTVAFDFGTVYHTGFKDLRIGMSFRNFSRSVKYSFESFNLPVTFRVGLAMDVLSLFPGLEGHELQVCLEAVHPNDVGERLHFGCEYGFQNLFAVRAGYRTNVDLGALSFGFGLTPRLKNGMQFRLDYAYSVAEEVFDTIQRISFAFAF